ncbi:MAG: NYN domain-containing protein [Candidatus Diapherotrites archaeon]
MEAAKLFLRVEKNTWISCYLATDMLSFAYENIYDTAIIVSGDGDFVPTIKRVQKLGKKVVNAYFRVSSSNFLKKVCDSSICLDDFISDICLKNKN